MHPLLFSIGSIQIHTYGLLIAVGFLLALFVVWRLSLREKLPAEKMIDLTFIALLAGFLGARILFIITTVQNFVQDPMDMFRVWEGGLVFYGGPIAALPVIYYLVRRLKLSPWKVGDVAFTALTIAHAFGRFGCFSAGCCYGKPTDSFVGMKFNSPLVEPALRGVPIHPTQLYEAFSLIVLFFGLLYVQRHKKFDGQVMLVYLMTYPIIRSIIEIFRGDQIRGFVIDDVISTSQFISIGVFALATWFLVRRLRQVHLHQNRGMA